MSTYPEDPLIMHEGRTHFHPPDGTLPRRDLLRCFAGLTVILCACVLIGHPEGQHPIPNQMGQQPRGTFDGFEDNDPVLAARQMRALNAERQKNMVSDTEKLLKLAEELNTEIGNSNRDELTQVQLREISDIEKLARNVKQKMSISFAGGPTFQEPVLHQMQ